MAKKSVKKNQICLVLIDNKPEAKIDLKKLTDLDYNPATVITKFSDSSFLEASRTDEGIIFLYSDLKRRDPKEFVNYVQELLKKKGYGDRFRVDKVYNMIEFVKSTSNADFGRFTSAIHEGARKGYSCR